MIRKKEGYKESKKERKGCMNKFYNKKSNFHSVHIHNFTSCKIQTKSSNLIRNKIFMTHFDLIFPAIFVVF